MRALRAFCYRQFDSSEQSSASLSLVSTAATANTSATVSTRAVTVSSDAPMDVSVTIFMVVIFICYLVLAGLCVLIVNSLAWGFWLSLFLKVIGIFVGTIVLLVVCGLILVMMDRPSKRKNTDIVPDIVPTKLTGMMPEKPPEERPDKKSNK